MDRPGDDAMRAGDFDIVSDRINERSAMAAGMIADQSAGEAAAELGLRRTQALLERLGRPQDAYAVVHVAGSKGKGSTSAMIAACLKAAGHRTGRATSPHLYRFTERIAIDGRDIEDGCFADVATEVLDAAEAMEQEDPTLGTVNAYEVLLAVALVAFRRAGCVAVVVEVGIGGRLDASNVVDPAVSVITTLDLEHTAILGPTLVDIAREKAGITKPGRAVVVAPQPPDAMAVIRRRAAEMSSPLVVVGSDDITVAPVPRRLPGPHQRLNAAVATAAVRELAGSRPELRVDRHAIVAGIEAAHLPGRFEIIEAARVSRFAARDDPLAVVVLDGAHTPLAAAALRETVISEFGPDRPVHAVVGLASDKDVRAVLSALEPALVLPVAAASPRSIPVSTIAATARGMGINVVTAGGGAVAEGIREALRLDPVAVVVVTGSFSVVADARVAFGLDLSPPDVSLL
ncbi:MAG TPA: Mur ligase family protein [Thermomicrobiales bacterium]|nr:Mur ligase family protein [Thermomicrobiales bacterium]